MFGWGKHAWARLKRKKARRFLQRLYLPSWSFPANPLPILNICLGHTLVVKRSITAKVVVIPKTNQTKASYEIRGFFFSLFEPIFLFMIRWYFTERRKGNPLFYLCTLYVLVTSTCCPRNYRCVNATATTLNKKKLHFPSRTWNFRLFLFIR